MQLVTGRPIDQWVDAGMRSQPLAARQSCAAAIAEFRRIAVFWTGFALFPPQFKVTADGRFVSRSASGQPVEIRGACYSACALKLASGDGLCVAPSARIGVHEVRRAVSPASHRLGARDDLATAFFETLLPRCAHDLFASLQGFARGALTVVSGRDILAACPKIHACPDSRFASTGGPGHL